MLGKRKLTKQSVWDVPALLSAFSEQGIKHSNAQRLWGWVLIDIASARASVTQQLHDYASPATLIFTAVTSSATQTQRGPTSQTSLRQQ
jgi:hypothetical protein